MEGLSKSAYARRRKALGFKAASRQAVHEADSKGWLVLYEDGSIDPDASDRRWSESSSRGPGVQEHDRTVGADYAKERALHERAKRELAELKLRIERGELVDAEEAGRLQFTLARTTRDLVLGVTARVAPMFGLDAPQRAALDKELRAALRGVRAVVETDGEEY